VVFILLMVSGAYFINGYWWFFFLLMVSGGYSINGYWWLFY
jgi:hypothetical protein